MYRNRLVLLASTALTLASVQSAKAAAPITYSWTGFYVGANLGYSWGKADTTAMVSPLFYSPFSYTFPGGSNFFSLTPAGAIGGGQIGYNWDFASRWLAGIEADWQWSGQKSSKFGSFGGIDTTCIPGTGPFCNFTNTTDITAKLSWFSTVRARVGVFDSRHILFYGTAGIAYGRISVAGVNNLAITQTGTGTATFSTPFSYSSTKVGYAVGGGAEGRIGASNWTWKVEYLHIDLGSVGGGSFGSSPVVTLNTGKFTDEIVRVGLNYQFGAAPLP
jgi:outer membrane immunogenic protein